MYRRPALTLSNFYSVSVTALLILATPFLSGCNPSPSAAKTAAPQEEVVVEVRDAPKNPTKKTQIGTAAVSAKTTFVREANAPLIIPMPKRITVTGTAPFAITAETRIVVPDGAHADEMRGPQLLAKEIQRHCGILVPIVAVSQAGPAPSAILFGGPTPNPLVMPLHQAKILPAVPNKPEGYAVGVGQGKVAIVGKDTAGILWGAQTVVQLLTEGKPEIKGASVADWPSLSLRSAHLFHGREALPFHKKLISRIFSRHKLNALFLEVEEVRWDHDPGAAPEWAGTPAQIREEIHFARDHGLTVYPLLQGYGHLQYVLGRGDRNKYAEDPDIPYALCFTDLAAVSYWEGFIAEADTVFDAPAFHIGLDEVVDPVQKEKRGRFPFRSKGKTFSELFLMGANHWYNFLKARNKPMFMWADQALHPSEVKPDFGTAPSVEDAQKIRAGLPKDIIMCTWQYTARKDYPSLKKLRDAGFEKVVAATWFEPGNIQNFSKAAVEAGAIGAMQTTWAGYESKEEVLQKQKKQFVAMVLAAEYFWNGGEGPTPDKLPYDPEKIFDQEWASLNTVP